MRRSYYRNSNPGGFENKKPFFSKPPISLVQTKTEPDPFFQKKNLTTGRQGDKYEQEADSIADAVTSSSSTTGPILKKEISTIQPGSLADPLGYKKPLNDLQRRQEGNLVQERPDIQAMEFKEEEPEALQRMEEEEEIQMMEEEEEVQMMEEEDEVQMVEEEEPEALQKFQTKGATAGHTANSSISQQIINSAGKGRQLPHKINNELGSAFGTDFSGVGIHTDEEAAQMSKALHAQAFTYGSDIYFNRGNYNPDSVKGKHLIAHELTHVVQQGHAGKADHHRKPGRVIQGKSPERDPGNTSSGTSGSSGSSGATATTCGRPADCPAEFCTPFPSHFDALAARTALAPVLLSGIAAKVSPRVVFLWSQYLFGGASPQDLTSTFGFDFMTSLTTADTTDFLVEELKDSLTVSPPTFPAGVDTIVIDIDSRISSAITDIGTEGSVNEMNFDVIGEIPGNIAGGIGTTQISCPVGARPSPFNDSREVKGQAVVNRNPDGTLTVIPFFHYTVKDTIDLCPGNCGATIEQIATIPMSMMEASGISGDVPFTVKFPSMPVTPVTITPSIPVDTKSNGEITASALRIRRKPFLSAKILGRYLRGEKIDIICQTTGSSVLGNTTWYKTDKGFISGRYVSLKTGTPPVC